MRDYSQIIYILVAIEQHFPVDKLTYKGLHVWPIIRNTIASDLFWDVPCDPCSDTALGRPPGHTVRQRIAEALPRRLSNTLFQTVANRIERQQRAEILKLSESFADHYDAFFLTVGFEYTLVKNAYYNKFIDPIKELMDSLQYSYLDFETGFQGGTFKPKYFETVNIKKIMARAAAKATLPLRPDEHDDIVYFDELLAYLRDNKLPVCVDRATIIKHCKAILSYAVLFEELLSKMKPKVCVVVCYYHDVAMACIYASKKLGIKTIEIQHAIINKDDWNWTKWMNVPKGGYELLPDYFWAWARQYADLLSCWTKNSPTNLMPLIGGNIWFTKWMSPDSAFRTVLPASLSGKTRTILCTIPFGDQKMINEIIPPVLTEAIQRSPASWKWLIRLHYKSDRKLVDFITKFLSTWSDKAEVHHATEYQLYDVFNISDYHVSQTCSTVLEAEIFDLPNIIIGEIGKSWFSEEIRQGIYFYAATPDELLSLITDNAKPSNRSESPVVTDSKSASKLLSDLVHQL